MPNTLVGILIAPAVGQAAEVSDREPISIVREYESIVCQYENCFAGFCIVGVL